MLKKHALKFFIISLCALLVMPFAVIKGGDVNASTSIVAPRSVESVYTVANEDLKTSASAVFVDGVKVYNDGALLENDEAVTTDDIISSITSMSLKNGVLTFAFSKNGNYVIKVANSDDTLNESFDLVVTSDASLLPKISYNLDSTAIANFNAKIQEAATKDGATLKIGDTYTIPSFEEVLNLNGYNYANLTRTVYYAAKGSNYYSSTTNSFELLTVGVYKLYAVFSSDEMIIGNPDTALSINVENLIEKEDGFYSVTEGSTKLYVRKLANGIYEYYYDEELKNKVSESATLTETLVVPTFSFEILGSTPTVKSNSTYQEKGYIDYQYSGVSFTAKGNDITTTYELEFSANGSDNWAKAEEELTSTLAFTPTKKGFYRVTATTIDCEGNTVTATTANIEVADKFTTVKFKTSFSDWLAVNTVPFIFACISVCALIALIVVILIPVKDNKEVVKAEESDR